MSAPAWRILLADDDEFFCGLVQELLMDDGYEVVVAHSAPDARKALRRERIDVAVLDLQLTDEPNDTSGLEIAVKDARGIPSILLTNHKEKDWNEITGLMDSFGVPHNRLPQVVFKQVLKEDPALAGLRREIRKRLVPRVFVVHGHNTAVRNEVVDKLKRMRLKPQVLDVAPGQMILASFRRRAMCAHYAIVILTPDDLGAPVGKLQPALQTRDRNATLGALATLDKELHPRARQNVIFELGFFFALLGLDRVLVLYDERVELPSDTHGVGYVPLDGENRWRERMEDVLRKAGLVRKRPQPK